MRTVQRAIVAVTVGAACAALTFPVAAATAAPATRAPASPRALALAALRGLRSRPAAGRVVRDGAGSTTDATSVNWSGYVDLPSAGKKFDSVKGSWTEPSLTCTSDEDQEAVFWVGVDGWTNDTVEQAGTFAECYEGTAYYYTWWEMYPTNDITVVGSTVLPGDHITASVVYKASTKKYTLAVTDTTTAGNGFSIVEKCAKGLTCHNASAEWIGETPGNIRGYYPLPDFGTWAVTGGEAAEGTSTKAISHYNNDKVTLESDADYPLATPSALTSAGTGFTDTWDNSY
jgi:hypothetical protein